MYSRFSRSTWFNGPLFPYPRTLRAGDRATEFRQRCDGLKIYGILPRSYWYAWAQRARNSGYPERFAREALGHQSRAVHLASARKATGIVPSLESYEQIQHKDKPIELKATVASIATDS